MMYTSHFTGRGLVDALRVDDGMTSEEAEIWIAKRTGRPFDPLGMYGLRWPTTSQGRGYRNLDGLCVHVMTDSELEGLERKVRTENKMPPRKPGERPMFESSMGRHDPPRGAS